MKKLLLILIITAAAASAIFAEEAADNFKTGSQALLFSLNGLSNFGPGPFNGGAGYQYYFAENTAFRFSIGGSYNSETTERPEGMENNQVSSGMGLSFMPGIRFNRPSGSNISAYGGFEGLISFSRDIIEGFEFTNIEKSENRFSFGIGAFAGAEWFPWENVSISAEYGLMFRASSGSAMITDGANEQEQSLPSTISIDLGLSQAKFILSFHFD